MLVELEKQILEIYKLLDDEVTAFARRTGLNCPEGCGRCCVSEKVEATVLEFIPMAFELFRTNQAEFLLKRLEKNDTSKRCILFRQDLMESGKWGCTQYRHRVLICRLFGFAGNRDRHGNLQLAMCLIMKTGRENFEYDLSDKIGPMPIFTDAGMRITAMNPLLGAHRLPINHALMEALTKVGMYLALSQSGSHKESVDPEMPPETPLFPENSPRKRAA